MKKLVGSYPHSLKARLIFLTLLFLLLPTGILGYLGYDYLYNTIKNNNIHAVGYIADSRHEQLNVMLQNTNNHATRFLNNLSMQCDERDAKKNHDCLQKALKMFLIDTQAVSATLTNQNNVDIAKVGKEITFDDVPFKPLQLAGFIETNQHYFIVAKNQKGERLTVIFPVNTIQEIFVTDPRLGASGDVFIMDSKGFFISQPRLLDTNSPQEAKNDHAMHHCLMMGNAEMLDVDRRNVEIIHSFRFVPEIGGGCIMAHLDQAEAFATLHMLQWRVIWITLGLIVFALIIAVMVGRKIVKPIEKLCAVTHQIINGNYTVSAVVSGDSEIAELANAFNLMTERLRSAFNELNAHRAQLEHKVKKRTAELSIAKDEAEQSLRLLQETQENLVQAEKMAALGGLVAGISHEINTPIGITVTSASFLNAETNKVMLLYQEGELGGDELESYFETAKQSTHLMMINCQRAADLIQSFKQISVDQTSEQLREFNLKNYLDEILLSLRPALKKRLIDVKLDCLPSLFVLGYPGAISQIVTNFVMNSLLHAYDSNENGTITLSVSLLSADKIELRYSDNGKGIRPDIQSKIFDPFFTTQRGNGGSGLGLHVVYNLVHQVLKGSLQINSIEGKGTTFTLNFPKRMQENPKL
jgi:signal transduction histidine kinase